MVDNSLIINV